MNLIYINELGPDYKGHNIYEFIFSEKTDVWGDRWESKPSNSYPSPPDLEYIQKVGVLKNTDIKLSLIQHSDYFSMEEAIDGIIALGWENESFGNNGRLYFRFGDNEDLVKDKLYEKDLILEFDKKVIYEK
jgi:hypothetical protein